VGKSKLTNCERMVHVSGFHEGATQDTSTSQLVAPSWMPVLCRIVQSDANVAFVGTILILTRPSGFTNRLPDTACHTVKAK
jgi:hypothetical protein